MKRLMTTALAMSVIGVTPVFAETMQHGQKAVDAAPILVDRSVPAVQRLIEESDDVDYVAATTVTYTSPVASNDPTPAALVDVVDTNAVTGVELEPRAPAQLGAREIEVPEGSVEDIERGMIQYVQRADSGKPLAIGADITEGDLYYGKDGTVYQYTGSYRF